MTQVYQHPRFNARIVNTGSSHAHLTLPVPPEVFSWLRQIRPEHSGLTVDGLGAEVTLHPSGSSEVTLVSARDLVDELRQSGLAKLTQDERRALGLERPDEEDQPIDPAKFRVGAAS